MKLIKIFTTNGDLLDLYVNPTHVLSVHEDESGVFISTVAHDERTNVVYKSSEPLSRTIQRLS